MAMDPSYELLSQAKPGNELVAVDDGAPEDEQEDLSRSDSLRVSDATKTQHSTTIHRSNTIFLLVLTYATLAIFAWTISCVLAYRPIQGGSYSINTHDSHYDETPRSLDHFRALYLDNEAWYRAARIIQSIVTVLTIPLTSAVCGRAAVAFIQQPSHSGSITMRQTMVLADKGWADVGLISKLLRGQWKRFGSSFLAVAISLNILGAIISPFQELFLFTETIKTPTRWQAVNNLVDMTGHVKSDQGDDYTVVLTRSRLSSTRVTDLQARLWSKGGLNCTGTDSSTLELCQAGGSQNMLAGLPLMQDPFFAELPYNFSTGLLSQFIPRVNSTARREIIDNDDFPPDCGEIPDALYITYSNTSEDSSTDNPASFYSIEVCMPGNMSQPAWSAKKTRQQWNEELYLKISLQNCTNYPSGVYSSKITLNTTVGYFELPNYANGELPGPLLQDKPDNHCGSSCVDQATIHETDLNPRGTATGSGTAVNATSAVLSNYKKGPLLTISLALFGIGSFLDVVDDLAAYREAHRELDLEEEGECITTVPFLPLTKTMGSDYSSMSNNFPFLDPCFQFKTTTTTDSRQLDANDLAAEYLWMFLYNEVEANTASTNYDPAEDYDGKRIVNALEAAAFIANEVWMVEDPRVILRQLRVSSDMGEDMQKPAISNVGIIVVSILLVLDLFSLAALALYSARVPRWTEQLDSFAMMRLGAVMADGLPLQITNKTERISILDETPGYIGDATGGNGTVGELGLGAKTTLRARRRYTCYEGDHESKSVAEKQHRQLGNPDIRKRENATQ